MPLSPKPYNDSFTTVTATGDVDGVHNYELINAGATVVRTLPAASSMILGRRLSFRRIDTTTNTVTIAPNGADTIDGSTAAVNIDTQEVLTLFTVSLTEWRKEESRPNFTTYVNNNGTTPVTVSQTFNTWLGTSAAGNLTYNLPAASTVPNGRVLSFRNRGGVNNMTLARNGTDTIDGAGANYTLAGPGGIKLISDGVSNWWTSP